VDKLGVVEALDKMVDGKLHTDDVIVLQVGNANVIEKI
jgi:hypothetical protein